MSWLYRRYLTEVSTAIQVFNSGPGTAPNLPVLHYFQPSSSADCKRFTWFSRIILMWLKKYYTDLGWQSSWKAWVPGLRSSFPTTLPERLTAVSRGMPTLRRNSISHKSRTFDSLPKFAGRPGRVREKQCVLGPGAPLSCLWVTQSLPQEWLVHTFHQERGLVHPALSVIVLYRIDLESIAASDQHMLPRVRAPLKGGKGTR